MNEASGFSVKGGLRVAQMLKETRSGDTSSLSAHYLGRDYGQDDRAVDDMLALFADGSSIGPPTSPPGKGGKGRGGVRRQGRLEFKLEPERVLDAEELEPRAAMDYNGKHHYHLRKIVSKYPVSGTQVKIEKARQKTAEDRRVHAAVVTANSRLAEITTRTKGFDHERPMKEFDVGRVIIAPPNPLKARAHQFFDKNRIHVTLEQIMTAVREQKAIQDEMIATKARRLRDRAPHSSQQVRATNFVKMARAGQWDGFRTTQTWCEAGFEEYNYTDTNIGLTPMMIIAKHARTTASASYVRLLCEVGADPNNITSTWNTALHLACDAKRFPTEAEYEDHPLRAAREYAKMQVTAERHAKIVKALLGGGAEPDRLNYSGQTPLSLAAARGYEPIVELLLDAGADPYIPDRWGRMPVDRAKGNGHTACYGLMQNRLLIKREKESDVVVRDLVQKVKDAGGHLGTGSAVQVLKSDPPAASLINTIRLQEFRRIHLQKTFLNDDGSVKLTDNAEAEKSRKTLDEHYERIRKAKEDERQYIEAKMKDDQAVRDSDKLPPFQGTKRCLRRGGISSKKPIVNLLKRRSAAAALSSDAYVQPGCRPAQLSAIRKRPTYDMGMLERTNPWTCAVCTKENRAMDKNCACCGRERPEQLDLHRKLGVL